jgi:hypothetical protein
MPFQFYCPQGHLLEGQESQMGQQSQCPICGAGFMIPVVQGAAPPQPDPTPNIATGPAFSGAAAATSAPMTEAPAPAQPEAPKEPRVVRIPCPNGHVLETPSDMFGQQALCPYCNTQFELRYEDSAEYAEEQAEIKSRREEELNAQWVKWSIRAAIFVVVMLVGMIVYMTFIKPML